MPLWSCGWDGCENAAAQRLGDCLLCDGHFCRTHRQEPWHKCPTPEGDWNTYSKQYQITEARHVDMLYQSIDRMKLCSRASELRDGVPCSVEMSQMSLFAMMGGQNCHVDITFQDDVRWIARFRLARTSSPPREVRDWILRSEAATMVYLQQNTCIPTPKVFDWACESDPENAVGVGYILMEKLDGKPLEWKTATSAQREKVMQQLVEIFLEIEQHPFRAVGSLAYSNENQASIQGLAKQSTYRVGQGPLGPFSTSSEASQAVISTYLAMIASGEIDGHSPVNIYLTHRLRLDIVGDLPGGAQSDDRFFLKHPDDKGDHILVNDAHEIVGIIDWEWAQTVSKAEAFCSPCMMWPVGKFYSGSNELTADEIRLADIFKQRGRQDLATCVLDGRKIQRFVFALGTDNSFTDMKTFTRLFAGLQDAFGSVDDEWTSWKERAIEKWKDDEMLLGLLKLEVDAGSSSDR